MTIHVYRCAECGDTFPADPTELTRPTDPFAPADTGERPPCPSCGSINVEPAWEPLL